MILPTTDPAEAAAAAHAAEQAGLFDEALQHWTAFRKEHPSRVTGYLGAIMTARSAGLTDLANQFIVEGFKRLPGNTTLATMAGQLLPEAIEKAERQSASRIVKNLEDCRTKGDTLLDTALAPTLRQRPGREILLTALANVEALESKRPGRTDIRSAYLRLSQTLGRFVQAQERGQKWLVDHPSDTAFVLLVAEVLENSGDVAAACEVVEALRMRVGSYPDIDARLMSLTARVPEADVDAVLKRSLAEHPRNPLVLREWAVIAQRRGDWDEALRRWQAADRIVPKDRTIMKGLRACQLQLAMDRAVDTTELAKLFGSFSSLGGAIGGCEFGMIQSRHGSKALGLFRWSNISAEDLARGFEAGFIGLGTPENVELTTNRGPNGLDEYMVQDKAYNSSTHTRIFTKDAPMEKVRDQTVRRLGYLKNGLLDQLHKPNKIFVYKFLSSLRGSRPHINRLWTALRQYGRVELLCAVLSDDEIKHGTILVLEDGLYVGFLGRMMDFNGIPEDGFDELGWRGICTAVLGESIELGSTGPVMAAHAQGVSA